MNRATPVGALNSDEARNAVAAVAKGCSGHVGLAARHLKAPLATATPAELCRLLADLFAGSVVDRAASAQMITTLRYQQDKSLFPRAYLEVAAPEEPPGPQAPAIAHKTGCVSGCRADTGLLHLPESVAPLPTARLRTGWPTRP